jgi:hypothetical protein
MISFLSQLLIVGQTAETQRGRNSILTPDICLLLTYLESAEEDVDMILLVKGQPSGMTTTPRYPRVIFSYTPLVLQATTQLTKCICLYQVCSK